MPNIINTRKLNRTGIIKNSIQSMILSLINSNNDHRQWYIEERDFPKTYIGLTDPTYNCSLRKLLLATGIAMTNVNSPELPESWYAILKHLNTFSYTNHELFANLHIKDLDFHKKTIYADELAMGVAVCVLGDLYNIKFIADASDFIFNNNTYLRSGNLTAKSPFNNKQLRAIYKKLQPDFFCIGSDRKIVIAEAKGSFGKKSNLNEPLKKGSDQVKSVKPKGATLREEGGRLVLATHFPIEGYNTRSKPHTIVLDPEETCAIEIDVEEDEIIKFSLAKSFVYMGLGDLAINIMNNKTIDDFLDKEYPVKRIDKNSCIIIKRLDINHSFVIDDTLFYSLKEYNNKLEKYNNVLEEILKIVENRSIRALIRKFVENNIIKYIDKCLESLIIHIENKDKEVVKSLLDSIKVDLSHIEGSFEIFNKSLEELKEFKKYLDAIYIFLELTKLKPSLYKILSNEGYFEREFEENDSICMLPIGVGLLTETNIIHNTRRRRR